MGGRRLRRSSGTLRSTTSGRQSRVSDGELRRGGTGTAEPNDATEQRGAPSISRTSNSSRSFGLRDQPPKLRGRSRSCMGHQTRRPGAGWRQRQGDCSKNRDLIPRRIRRWSCCAICELSLRPFYFFLFAFVAVVCDPCGAIGGVDSRCESELPRGSYRGPSDVAQAQSQRTVDRDSHMATARNTRPPYPSIILCGQNGRRSTRVRFQASLGDDRMMGGRA